MRGDPLQVGDRITWSEYFFDGDGYYREVHDMPQKCQGVRKYGHDLAEEDPHFLGGFAEYCYILPGTWILKLPDELSDEEATPLNCGVATMAAVTEAADIALGDTVVVQGLGCSGSMAWRWPRRVVRDVPSASTRFPRGWRRRSSSAPTCARRRRHVAEENVWPSARGCPARRRRRLHRSVRRARGDRAGTADASRWRPLHARRPGQSRTRTSPSTPTCW